MPKFHLLYFKNLLDVAFCKFFELYNDDFIKEDGRYVLASSLTTARLAKTFTALVVE